MLFNYKQKFLLDYVQNGGNMVVQYNTSRRVNVAPPYALQLSRDRVTDENNFWHWQCKKLVSLKRSMHRIIDNCHFTF